MDRPRFSLRLHSAAEEETRIFARRHSASVGAAVSFDSEHPRLTAVELMFGAIGAEIVGAIRAEAKRRRIEVDAIEATVHGELDDALAAVGVIGASGTPAVHRIALRIYVSTFASVAEVNEVFEEAKRRSVAAATFGEKLDLTLKIAT